VEAKQIPNLAWDLAPYSDRTPDLVQANHTSTLTTTPCADVVKAYLLAH
jgi:hypothetical protein